MERHGIHIPRSVTLRMGDEVGRALGTAQHGTPNRAAARGQLINTDDTTPVDVPYRPGQTIRRACGLTSGILCIPYVVLRLHLGPLRRGSAQVSQGLCGNAPGRCLQRLRPGSSPMARSWRPGCLAHARRKVFTTPAAKIRWWRCRSSKRSASFTDVERTAQGKSGRHCARARPGTPKIWPRRSRARLALRREKSAPLMEKLKGRLPRSQGGAVAQKRTGRGGRPTA